MSVALTSAELSALFSPYDLKRLEMYSGSMVDYHLIMDMIPSVARMYFLKKLGTVSLSAAQCVSWRLNYFKDLFAISPLLFSLNYECVCVCVSEG